jgi:hypothetical protein
MFYHVLSCSIMFYPIPLNCLLHGGLYSNPHSTRWLITPNSNFHNPPTNKGIPSGKHTKIHGKIRHAINGKTHYLDYGHGFNSFLLVITRGYMEKSIKIH